MKKRFVTSKLKNYIYFLSFKKYFLHAPRRKNTNPTFIKTKSVAKSMCHYVFSVKNRKWLKIKK